MSFYRGYRRPGPLPPRGIEPESGETLDFICGEYRIFQYEKGHRYSTDDVLTAWYGTQWAPRVERACDLGSGIGSVAIIAAWRFAIGKGVVWGSALLLFFVLLPLVVDFVIIRTTGNIGWFVARAAVGAALIPGIYGAWAARGWQPTPDYGEVFE